MTDGTRSCLIAGAAGPGRAAVGGRGCVVGVLLAGLVVGLGLAAGAAAQEPGQPVQRRQFTSEDVARLRTVLSAEISPDGQQVAYLVTRPRIPFRDDDGGAWVELWLVDRDGEARPFVSGKVNVSGVKWLPDGKHISFLAKRDDDKNRSLYVIPASGGEARNVYSYKNGMNACVWQPDGGGVLFTATDEEPKEIKRLADKGMKAEVYEEMDRPVRLYRAAVNLDPAAIGEEFAEPEEIEVDGTPIELAVSPDGSKLALAVAPSPRIDDEYMNTRLRIVDARSGAVEARIENPGKLGTFAFSPDGKHLALLSALEIHDPSAGRLMVADVSSGKLRELAPNYEGAFVDIAWQDNATVMYVAHEGTEALLGEIDIDSGERKTHVPTGMGIFRSLSLREDGQAGAFVVETPRHPREVYFMAHGDRQPRRLTVSNAWLSDVPLANQEAVTYKARDGVEIGGVLIYPLLYEAGERYPLIVAVHGGPEAHESDGWLTSYSEPGQVAAAKGFAVLYPNYRGSTGRGVKFSQMDQRDYAGPEFDDLVDGVKHLVEQGLVDEKKVGITGGSYGGYAAAWGATKLTEHFAASVMFVGISELVSKFGTTDIPQEMYLVHARVWPWEDWDFFIERSPVRYAPQARTPLLILHGKNDPRVHPSQSMILYRYLKTLGQTPVRLVLYPGEGHGNRNAGARYDYNLRMMRWFEHYLQGDGGAPPPADLAYPLDEDGADAGADGPEAEAGVVSRPQPTAAVGD